MMPPSPQDICEWDMTNTSLIIPQGWTQMAGIIFLISLCLLRTRPKKEPIPRANHATTKTICSNTSIFFRSGSKFDPLLQIERIYCSNRPAHKNIFLGMDHSLTRL